MEGNTLKLQLLEKKDFAEPEIDIRYSSMTQPLNRIVQYIRQQEYLIQGIFEKKLYQIPLNEVLYFETVDKKTFMYTQHKIFLVWSALNLTLTTDYWQNLTMKKI